MLCKLRTPRHTCAALTPTPSPARRLSGKESGEVEGEGFSAHERDYGKGDRSPRRTSELGCSWHHLGTGQLVDVDGALYDAFTFTGQTLAGCKELCELYRGCVGISYESAGSTRCKVHAVDRTTSGDPPGSEPSTQTDGSPSSTPEDGGGGTGAGVSANGDGSGHH